MRKLPALHKLSLIVMIFISCTLTAAENPSSEWLSINGNNGEDVSVTFVTPTVELINLEFDGQSFSQIDVTSDAVIGQIGGPVLPGWSRWIELPTGMKPVLTMQVGNCETITDVKIAPFPISDFNNQDATSIIKTNPVDYSSKELLPAQPATISDPISIGGTRFTVLTISPYQYNPNKEELHVYENLNVDISFENDPTAEASPDRQMAPAMDELVRSLSDLPPRRDDGNLHQDNLGGYVIVTPDDDDIIEAIEPLAEWKRRKGFVVTMLNIDDVNGRVGLREYLINAGHNWDIPPTFVLLAGDGNGRYDIPFYDDGQQGAWVGWHISDNQFVIWDYENPEGARPEEWIPNAFIGRLPAERIEHMEYMVAKILAYEIEPYTDEPWVEGAQLIAQGVRSCIHANVAVRELMQGFGYERDNLHEAYADYPQAIDVNGVINHINDGVGFINFRGYNNWGNINQYMISELENAWMLPIVTGMVCGTNDFIAAWGDSSPLGRGEAFVRAWNDNAGVGGVACFGPTDLYTRTWFNNALDGEFYYSLFNRGITYLGGLCIAAKIRLISTYPSHLILENGDNVGYYFYTYTLLGDPGMQVRTREPIPIEADYSSNYPAGTTSLDVIVFEDEEPIVGAYVHIYLDDDVRYGAFTDDEGVAVIDVDPLEIGTYLLTVTGQNLIPVLDDFEVIVAEVFLALDEIEIDDDDNDDSDGNGDGIMNPGETIELNITIRNSGSEDSDGANASLSSDSPWIDEITSSEAEYDEIASGQTSAGNQPFVFNLLPATPNGTELNFELRIVSDDNEWKKSFNLSVNGYDFTVVHFLFSDTLLTPGTEQELTIELENTGSINARELSATLYCDHRSVQIRAAESFYEPIASGDTAENNPDIPFEVLVSPNAYNGSEASFGLLLTDETGMSDSLIFTTTLGEPTPDVPQGPDGYGYWAFDNRDTTSGMAPEYEWIEGRTSLNGINDQQGVGDEGSRVLQELPFEFIYYGREYTEITINSNGWMCFGRSDQFSWNNQGMGSAIAPPAMIAPFWTDLWSGEIHTWYDEENARYIIEWREWGGRNGNVTFEVILYDPTVVNTVTGDGEIVFQYETISNSFRDPYPREQATIGICSHNREDLLQITHADIWDERTRGLVSGSVIRFTTGEYTEIGAVFGRVLDIVDGSPLENAWVRIDGTGFFDRTDENGLFRIDNIPIGSYTVIASMRHFNEDLALEIEITDDGETRVPDFELTHPSFNIDREEVIYGLRPDSSGHRVFNIWNDGNGPLDYTIEIDSRAEPPEERDEQWEILFDYNLSDTARTGNWEGDDRDSSYTGDYNLKGVTFDGDYLYVAGAYVRSELPHLIYVINRDGERVRQFEQTSVVERPPTRGYWDIEFNGENLYAIEKDTVIEVNRDGELVRAFLDPHGGSKLITYSREDGKIFTAGITDKEVVEFDANGDEAVVHSVDFNGIFKVYGMSLYPIDPDGFNLYMFVDNISNEEEPRLRIMKYNVETEELRHVTFLDYNSEYVPESCTITKLWNPLLWTFIGLLNHPTGDRVIGVELGPNLTWIGFDPDSASIPPHQNQPVTISFFAEGMPERDYYLLAKVLHNAVGDRHDIDIYFTIDSNWIDAVDDESALPSDFSFSPPHPNPFNPSTRLSFSLPEPALVELAVYDLTGRLVHEYDFGRLETGRHEAMFNGSGLSSGIYFATLKAGSRIATQKILLLK